MERDGCTHIGDDLMPDREGPTLVNVCNMGCQHYGYKSGPQLSDMCLLMGKEICEWDCHRILVETPPWCPLLPDVDGEENE